MDKKWWCSLDYICFYLFYVYYSIQHFYIFLHNTRTLQRGSWAKNILFSLAVNAHHLNIKCINATNTIHSIYLYEYMYMYVKCRYVIAHIWSLVRSNLYIACKCNLKIHSGARTQSMRTYIYLNIYILRQKSEKRTNTKAK